MALPVHEVRYPSVLDGQANGRLDPGLLGSFIPPGGGPPVRLLKVAVRSAKALTAAAAAAGFRLRIVSAADSYRTYEQQVALFESRYTVDPMNTSSRLWNGQRWYLLPGKFVAAVPGTSNHGRGLAGDWALETDGDPAPESISDEAVAWLVANAARFGWSAEVQSEKWHWRHFTGDAVTDAVLAYEAGLISTGEDTAMRFQFDDSVKGVPADRVGRIHITDSQRYRVLEKGATARVLTEDAGPIRTITGADLAAANWDYDHAVAQVCGTEDTGEQGATIILDGAALAAIMAQLLPQIEAAVTKVVTASLPSIAKAVLDEDHRRSES